MALEVSNFTDTKTGVVVNPVYVRICSITVGKVSENIPGSLGWGISIQVHVWNSAEDRGFESHPDPDLEKKYFMEKSYYFNPELDSSGDLPAELFTCSYDYLKTLDEFSGATDV